MPVPEHLKFYNCRRCTGQTIPYFLLMYFHLSKAVNPPSGQAYFKFELHISYDDETHTSSQGRCNARLKTCLSFCRRGRSLFELTKDTGNQTSPDKSTRGISPKGAHHCRNTKPKNESEKV